MTKRLEFAMNRQLYITVEDNEQCAHCGEETMCVEIPADDPYCLVTLCVPCLKLLISAVEASPSD